MTFRANPAFDTAEAITTLKTGEALVSFLDADGAPSIVERATILPPQSAMNAIDGDVRQECIESSPFRGVYDTPVDRVSAYEMLASAFQKEQMPAPEAAAPQISTAAPTVSRPDAFLVFTRRQGIMCSARLPSRWLRHSLWVRHSLPHRAARRVPRGWRRTNPHVRHGRISRSSSR